MLSSVWLFLKHPLPWLLCQYFPQVVFPHLPSLKLLFNLLCIHYLGPDYKCLSCSRCLSALTSSVASRLADLPSCLSSAPPLRCCNSIANSIHPAEFILFPIPLGPSPVETPSTGSYKSEPETLYQVVPLHPQHIIKSIDIGFKPIYIYIYILISSVQSLSHVWLFVNPWTAAHQASLSITRSQCLLKLMSIESVMPSNHLIFCRLLLLLSSIFTSIRVFSHESVLCIRWPKYWSFSFRISPSNEYSGLISFRMDWLDLLAAQGTLKSLLQHHSSKASILRCSAFCVVQLSHPYITTGKTKALTRRTLLAK